jgi:elongator complex protein 6
MAHGADFIMSLRLLDTGTARDVSGVLRVSIGDNAEQGVQDVRRGVEEKELLYFVGGDGGVKVFERG